VFENLVTDEQTDERKKEHCASACQSGMAEA